MICEWIGLERAATYSVAQELVSLVVKVGDSETRCRGRCGLGCWQLYQWRPNQYTQECLNHDVCRDMTNGNFGECKDEFWIAALGYVSAPDCPITVLHATH